MNRPITTPQPEQFLPVTDMEVNQLVQTPIDIIKGNYTNSSTQSLTEKTMQQLRLQFAGLGHSPSELQYAALQDAVFTLEAMANGSSRKVVHLSSLDPGVGKTSAIIAFIKQLLASPQHDDVSIIVCVSRLDEVRRLVDELDAASGDLSVLTSDSSVNALAPTQANYARVLITTQEMVTKRCAGQTFAETFCFHFNNRPRQVRVWDEAMLPGKVITLSTDQLQSLPNLLRKTCPTLGDLAGQLAADLLKAPKGSSFLVPDLQSSTGVNLSSALAQCSGEKTEGIQKALEALYAMSGQKVRLSMGNGRITTALNTRDALPKDLAPILVLDASGRVRYTYKAWESGPGGIIRLKDAPKDYSNLTLKVLASGGGRDTVNKRGEEYLMAIAAVINSKPDEDWLVIHHLHAMGGNFPKKLRELIEVRSSRVQTIHWGAHQGRNDFGHIENVILAGTLFYPVHHYEGLSYLCTGVPTDRELCSELLNKMTLGEHMDLVLQGLCRASVRGSDDDKCKPCNAYIIASKGSGICEALPMVFPGCKVVDWKALPTKARGKVANAISLLYAAATPH